MNRRLSDREYEDLMSKPEVRQAMRIRCEEDGRHEWENYCSAAFRIYQRCKWCGEER